MMRRALAISLGLLGLCSAWIDNVHLMVSGPVEFGQLQPWLARFPLSHFFLHGDEDASETNSGSSSEAISEALRLGYHVNWATLLDSHCPGSICALSKLGGLLASIEEDLELFTNISSVPETVLWKERKKTGGPCPWCINGVFEVRSSPIIAPAGSPIIVETIKLLGQRHELTRALMLSIKKHPQKANLLLKGMKLGQRKIRTSMVEYNPYLVAGGSLVGSVTITALSQIPFLSLTVADGDLACGDKTGQTLKVSFDSQAQYNIWIQSCRVSVAAPKTRITLDYGGDEAVDIWIYKIEELVTILVKTFGRMSKVRGLVESAQGFYPGVPILVGDDGEDSGLVKEGPLRGFYYHPFPYDIGLSEGRNRLVEKAKTECVLFLDDDFVLTDASDLGLLVHELNMGRHDLVAGKSPNCDTDYSGTMRVHKSKHGKNLLLLPQRKAIDGSTCERVEIVPNLFMARTSLFQKIKWDPQLKLGEHEDFFLRAKRLGIRVATCPGLTFDHHQTPEHLQSEHYRKMRGRVWGFLEIFLKKHGFSELVVFGKSKATLKQMAKIKSLAQVSAGPFSLTLRIETAEPHPAYKVDLETQDGMVLVTNILMNPEGLTSVEFPLTGLDPDRTYKVTVRPGNKDQFMDSGPTLCVRTLSFTDNNLIVNPSFDGSMLGWKKSLGTGSIGLMPLFFPQSEPDFQCKKDAGHFHEHIEGRPSEWASKARRIDRNYAGFIMAPPVSSFSRNRPAFFLYQDIKIPAACIEAECHLSAAAWARVDKIWGDSYLVLSVELLNKDGTIKEAHEYDMDPSNNQNWQMAFLDQQIQLSKNVERLRVALKVRCNVGAVFADDFFLSLIPI